MSEDFRLIKKRVLGDTPTPLQPADVTEYFGEQENDLQFGPTGDLDLVSGTEKLKQDINKILFTERGSNKFLDLYGTRLHGLIGSRIVLDNLKGVVKDDVVGALQLLALLNTENQDPEEKPDTLEFLSVDRPASDQINVALSVITEAGTRTENTVSIEL